MVVFLCLRAKLSLTLTFFWARSSKHLHFSGASTPQQKPLNCGDSPESFVLNPHAKVQHQGVPGRWHHLCSCRSWAATFGCKFMWILHSKCDWQRQTFEICGRVLFFPSPVSLIADIKTSKHDETVFLAIFPMYPTLCNCAQCRATRKHSRCLRLQFHLQLRFFADVPWATWTDVDRWECDFWGSTEELKSSVMMQSVVFLVKR